MKLISCIKSTKQSVLKPIGLLFAVGLFLFLYFVYLGHIVYGNKPFGPKAAAQAVEHTLLFFTFLGLIYYTRETSKLRKGADTQHRHTRTPQTRIQYMHFIEGRAVQKNSKVFTRYEIINEGPGLARDISFVWKTGDWTIPIKTVQQLRANDGAAELQYQSTYNPQENYPLTACGGGHTIEVEYKNAGGEEFHARFEGDAEYNDGIKIVCQGSGSIENCRCI